MSHDDGNTLKITVDFLQELNYLVNYAILNSSDFGLPQNRKRIYFVAFHNSLDSSVFHFPNALNIPISLQDILEKILPMPKTSSKKIWRFTKIFSIRTTFLEQQKSPINLSKQESKQRRTGRTDLSSFGSIHYTFWLWR